MKRSTLITATAFLGTGIITVPVLAFAATGSDQFVPLTQLPGLSTIAASSISLPSLINNLYKICIGLAAFFAVVQITWAGYLFMTSADSISANTKARGKIMNAVIGLVLVLAPFVVFSVINPAILNISLNFSSLNVPQGSTGVTPNANTAATSQTGSGVTGCYPGCSGTDVCSNGKCISAAQNETTCEAYSVIEAASSKNTCPGNEGRIPDSCCTPQAGFQCCGSK